MPSAYIGTPDENVTLLYDCYQAAADSFAESRPAGLLDQRAVEGGDLRIGVGLSVDTAQRTREGDGHGARTLAGSR